MLFIKKYFYNILSNDSWFFKKKKIVLEKAQKPDILIRNGGQIQIQHKKLLWKWHISSHEHMGPVILTGKSVNQCPNQQRKSIEVNFGEKNIFVIGYPYPYFTWTFLRVSFITYIFVEFFEGVEQCEKKIKIAHATLRTVMVHCSRSHTLEHNSITFFHG